MEPSLLQKWSALSELSDEEVNNIAYLVVYGSGDTFLTGKGLSVMYITRDTGEVYGAGWNTLIGWSTKGLPMKPNSNVYHGLSDEGGVKVAFLEGVEVEKLAVGWHVGAASARNKTLYIWGTVREVKTLSKGIIRFRIYKDGVPASCCSKTNDVHNYEISDVYGVKLSKCSNCGEYSTSSSRTSDEPVKPCVLYKFYKMECIKCESSCSSVTLGKHEVNYCEKCNILPEPHEYVTRTVTPIRKIALQSSLNVNGLSCGKSFCALWTSSNDLIIVGYIEDEYYEGPANVPDRGVLSGMSCGGEHLAVITEAGELYTCGKGDKGQLGYDWAPNMGFGTLRKVPLQGTVTKVCCGRSTTVCLTDDGSIWCFGAGLKVFSGEDLSVNHSESEILVTPTKIMKNKKFIDVANSHLSDTYWAINDASMVYKWGGKGPSHHPVLLFGVTNLMEALANEQSCVSVEVGAIPSIPHSRAQGDAEKIAAMYGSHLFSDLTLELADGEFPVHKLILYNASTYFHEMLELEPGCSMLDVKNYNPTAYKSLLMQFYQISVGDLQPDDLFDLYALAVSYKESGIVRDSFRKLKAILNDDTVLTLLGKSKDSNFAEILNLCETYVNSPQFRQKLTSLISNNMDYALEFLRINKNQ